MSRSGKNILHLDSNEYYGGPDAAFSLLEAADWTKISSGKHFSNTIGMSAFANCSSEKPAPPFSNVSIRQPESKSSNKLAPSRSYTLTLSPQIIYSKSKLLGQLVSSQVYRQLEFQAVGNWWIFSKTDATLKRLPNGREDVFSDRSIDVRAKRGLMKFLKFVIDFENQKDVWTASADTPLDEFLAQQFQLPETMQNVIGALTLSLDEPTKTTVAYSLPRIARHLTSIGVFGPGFGSVVPKWGGGAEIAQVSCRAGAVGGSVYVLGTGISSVTNDGGLALTSGDAVQSAFTVRTQDILKEKGEDAGDSVMKSISIISSDMGALFRATVEGAPSGAVAVIAFPGGSLGDDTSFQYPVYVMAHSNETGECPQDQCKHTLPFHLLPSTKSIL